MPVPGSPIPQRQPLSDGGQVDPDRILAAIATKRRRYILYYLMENEPADLNALVTAVVAQETGEPATRAADHIRAAVRTGLVHRELPKLADLGIIEYDRRSEAVRYRSPPAMLTAFLKLTRLLDEVVD